MKITVECTKEEKNHLINMLNDDCPFLHDESIKCKDDVLIKCYSCIEENIKWRIIND